MAPCASRLTRTSCSAGCRSGRSRRSTRDWRPPISPPDNAGTVRDITSCPGAESCKLAVTQSRGLASLLGEHLDQHPELIAEAPETVIKISGCPNGCGQHHVATIGFQGSVRKLDGQAVPQYFVMVGGDADGERTTFGRLAAKVPARRVPQVLERLLALYRAERRDDEDARAFFRRVEVPRVKAALHDLEVARRSIGRGRRLRRSGRDRLVPARRAARRMRGPLDHSALRVLGARAGTVAPSAADVRAWPGVAEAVVLATCHRTEIYLVADDIALGRRGVSAADVPAAHHLLRVACGLESPILGDGQILGQVRRAYLTARQAGATGPWLNRLFEAALHAGKRVRHHTDLGRGATTTAAAAVGVAERSGGRSWRDGTC